MTQVHMGEQAGENAPITADFSPDYRGGTMPEITGQEIAKDQPDKEKKPAKKKMPPGRDKNGRFLPGVSGNPKGRTSYLEPEVKKKLLAAVPGIAEGLIALTKDKKARPSDRIKASEVILDRVYGKAVAAVDTEVKGNINITFSSDDLEEYSE